MSTNYQVQIESFAERHYIKKFQKKYKGAWDLTRSALIREFQSFDVLLQRSIASVVIDREGVQICKTEFRVAGTNVSRKASGNRCIVAIHKETNIVCVLLVYHKNDMSSSNETAGWKRIVKEAYPEYRNFL
jgi:hypothetical protein